MAGYASRVHCKSTLSFLSNVFLCNVLVGGDYSNDSVCQEYWSYWQTADYPGLPSTGMAESRSYTPYVIDAVKLYFEVCDLLVQSNQSITALNVWNTLNTKIAAFRGCTGWVAIDPATGSRDTTSQPPVYDLVSLTQTDWQVRCCYTIEIR